MVPAPLRQHLREGTRDLHEALDLSIRAQPYLRSREGFREFLARSLAFQSVAERVLEEAGVQRLIPDWPLRRRAHLLRADLAALGHTPTDQIDEDMVAGSLVGPRDRAHVLGIAYVLEGSVLGAAVVSKEVDQHGLADGRTVSFLGAGSFPDRRWKVFMDLLDSHDEPSFDRDLALRAARAAFSAAHLCLVRTGEAQA